MPLIAEHYHFVIGVDTHAANHACAVIQADNSAITWQGQFPVMDAGLSRALAWAARLTTKPESLIVVVEGEGAHGAGVPRAFASAGHRIVEVDRQSVAHCRGVGKTDALAASQIARRVPALDIDGLREPRADGPRNALWILRSSRQLMTRESTASINSLSALVRSEAIGIDARTTGKGYYWGKSAPLPR